MPSDTKPIRAAIIGYGLSAKIFHLPFLQALPELFEVYGIVQRKPSPSSNAAQDFPGIKTWTSSAEMVKDPQVDLVVITSIPTVHVEQCKEALEAGKHVLCEKPFTPTSKEASELASLAKEKGLVLAVYQNRRWDADFVTLQSLVKDGALGRIVEAESHFDRHRPAPPAASSVTWKQGAAPGNGAAFDLGTHLLDQLVTLFGMPERITGFIGNQRIYTEEGTGADAGGDSFTILLHYDKRGLLATAKAGVVSAEPQQLRWWVRGEKGTFRKNNLDVQEDQLKEGLRPGDGGYGIEPSQLNGTLTTSDPNTSGAYATKVGPKSPPETYVKLYELLGKAIRGEGDNPVTAEEAANVIRLIELARESTTEGRTLKVDA